MPPEGMNLRRQVSCAPTFAEKASAGRLVAADSTTDAEGPGHAVPPTNCASWSVPYPRRTGLALLSRLPIPGDLFAWGMCPQIAPLTEGGMVFAATDPAAVPYDYLLLRLNPALARRCWVFFARDLASFL